MVEMRPRSPTILIVEEDAAVRQMLGVGLKRYGFQVFLAGGGKEALEILGDHRDDVDLALIDVRMEDLDGPQTMTLLRDVRADLPCCFMTGDSSSARTKELLKLGALQVFRKPFASLKELAKNLNDLTATG